MVFVYKNETITATRIHTMEVDVIPQNTSEIRVVDFICGVWECQETLCLLLFHTKLA